MNDNWIEYGNTFEEFVKEKIGDGDYDYLIRSGIQMLISDDGKESFILVGNINPEGGTCSCCNGVDDDAIVVRYRNIFA